MGNACLLNSASSWSWRLGRAGVSGGAAIPNVEVHANIAASAIARQRHLVVYKREPPQKRAVRWAGRLNGSFIPCTDYKQREGATGACGRCKSAGGQRKMAH